MLKDLKESNPVDVAEYVTARNLDDEVAFAWWVPYTLRKKATIIASVKSTGQKENSQIWHRDPYFGGRCNAD
jgi:hypothetical protein